MVGTTGEGKPGERAARADGRPLRVSSRVQDTIEGKAQDVTAPNTPPEAQVDMNANTTSFEAADAPLEHDVPHVPPPDGPVLDQPMPADPASAIETAEPAGGFHSEGEHKPSEPENAVPLGGAAMGGPVDLAVPATAGLATAGPENTDLSRADPEGVASLSRHNDTPRRGSMGLLLLGALVVLGAAGAAAWSTMGQGGGDLLSSVRRMVGYESTPKASSPAPTASSPTSLPAGSSVSFSGSPTSAPASSSSPPASSPPSQIARTPISPAATAPAASIGALQSSLAPQAGPAPQASSAPQASPTPQGGNVPPAVAARPPVSAPATVSTPATAPADARKPDSAPEPRKAELPATSAPTPPATPSSLNDPRIAELDRRLTDLDAKLGAVASSPAKPAADTVAALAAQTTRVAKIDNTLAAQTTRVGKIDDTLAGLDKRLASIEQQLATPKTDARAAQAPDVRTRDIDAGAARVVIAQGLLAAVQSGASFAQPLAALRALGVEEPTLARLSASAGAGVPSMAALRENFAVARAKLRPATKPTSGAGFGDTMMARLGSLVSIKPATERAGPSPDAVASRIDAALGRDDLAGALAEVRALPPGDAVLVKDWTDSATKRVEAEADARVLIAAGVAALAKPKS